MRKMNLKIGILTGVLVVAMLVLGTTKSQAVLQANATTHASPVSKSGGDWLLQIRQMEASGNTMGLTETINTSTYKATGDDNNIDVHLILPTEYGAIAILSVSGYGNPGKLRDETNAQKRTTTGNPTGVYFTGERWERVAATNSETLPYLLNYSASGQWRVGDSFGTCYCWHEGSGNWRYGTKRPHGIKVGGAGIFSYYGGSDDSDGIPYWDYGWLGRGVATIIQ